MNDIYENASVKICGGLNWNLQHGDIASHCVKLSILKHVLFWSLIYFEIFESV